MIMLENGRKNYLKSIILLPDGSRFYLRRMATL